MLLTLTWLTSLVKSPLVSTSMSANTPVSPFLPPPPPRHRASSTNLSSHCSLATLGRRRSASCLLTVQDLPASDSSPIPIEPISTTVPPPSMLVLFASRFLQWLHLPTKHSSSWSTPSSPRSSSDHFVLPVSADAEQDSFSISLPEEKISAQSHTIDWRYSFPIVIISSIVFSLFYAYLILRPGSRSNINRHHPFSTFHHVCFLLPINSSNIHVVAPHDRRCCSTGQGPAWLLSERSRSSLPRHGSHGHFCNLETCMVYSGQCLMGAYQLSNFF